MPDKTYLGNSVYADLTGSTIILTTDNGDGNFNIIYLDSEAIDALLKFKERIDNERRSHFYDNP